MPAWITVYCRSADPIPPPTQIEDALDSDWWTLGEFHELEEDEVDAFMGSLEWSDAPPEIRSPERRPLQFHTWTGARADEEVAELDERDLEIPTAVRLRLIGVKQVFAIEMGLSQLDTMYETVAFEIAYWLAEHRDGVILGENDAWFDHDKHRWDPFPSDQPTGEPGN